MNTQQPSPWEPLTFSLRWMGIATVVVLVVGLVAGWIRDDVAGTLGFVGMWGLLISAVVVGAVSSRRRRPSS